MTACSIIVQQNAAHLITDTGYFLDCGTLTHIRSKVVMVPEHRMAIAIRGAPIDLWTGIERLAAPTQAYLLAALPELASAILANARVQMRERCPVSLYMVRYDEMQRRAVGALMGSDPDEYEPLPAPWTWQPVQECLAPGVDLAELFGREPDTFDQTGFPIASGALRIIEAQRTDTSARPGQLPGCRVGGAAELTTVDADGVRVKELRRWPDRVGERISA